MNRETRNRALNILENGTQAQYQDEAVKEYLDAKTIAIDSIKKLNKIELLVNNWNDNVSWATSENFMHATLLTIIDILEQE